MTREGWTEGQPCGTNHGNIRSIEVGVYPTRQNLRYMLHTNAAEALQDIIAGCKIQTGKAQNAIPSG